MTLEELKKLCLSFKGSWLDFPFGEDVMVFKVASKLFALVSIDANPLWINVKCDPHMAIALRETYSAIQPGYHMNKKHWNTITLDGSIPEEEIKKFIEHSYNLIVKKLRKKEKESLQ